MSDGEDEYRQREMLISAERLMDSLSRVQTEVVEMDTRMLSDMRDLERAPARLINIGLWCAFAAVLFRVVMHVLFIFGPARPLERPDDLLFISLMIFGAIMVAAGGTLQALLVWRYQRAIVERGTATRLDGLTAEAYEHLRAARTKVSHDR